MFTTITIILRNFFCLQVEIHPNHPCYTTFSIHSLLLILKAFQTSSASITIVYAQILFFKMLFLGMTEEDLP